MYIWITNILEMVLDRVKFTVAIKVQVMYSFSLTHLHSKVQDKSHSNFDSEYV